jgi:alpha-L-rhamnosidase
MKFTIGSLDRRTFLKRLSMSGLSGQPWFRSGLKAAGILLPSTEKAAKADDSAPFFKSAQPIWPSGRDREMNLTVVFETKIDLPAQGPVLISIAASTLYRLTVNGSFRSWGPARGPHSFFRVDVLDITDRLKSGSNAVFIEVAGYNINSFWTLNQPSFLQAEITCAGSVLASTQGQGRQFSATIADGRLQRVQRYSFQRAFAESYRFGSGSALTSRSSASKNASVACAAASPRRLLARGAPHPDFSRREPKTRASSGSVGLADGARPILRPRFVANIGPKLLGYEEGELETKPYLEFQRFENWVLKPALTNYNAEQPEVLDQQEFRIFDFGTNLTGFLGMHVKVAAATHLYLTFDERLVGDDIDFTRLDCANIVEFYLEPGDHDLETFEPYTMRFVKTTVMKGSCAVLGIFLREYASADGLKATFLASDPELNRLFSAARETYRQNSVDLFTDCPSRERAGWLCDSFFTSRASLRLTGHTQMEETFFQNFLLPSHFEFIPEGMLPMCYPSDHNDGAYIVNWAMWFVLQLEQYLLRSGDRRMVADLKPRVLALLSYLAPFLNEDGLLENLGRHVYVDASEANKYVQGVNYPTNMLYVGMLDCIERLYGANASAVYTKHLRGVIKSQAFDGSFFADNAIREGGRLVRTQNRSEACQYYALYFGIARPNEEAALWKVLRDDFKTRGALVRYPHIPRCDILIGGILRFELLSRAGLVEQLLQECKDRLLYMAETTGTLWEHDSDQNSLNHGFEAHTAYLLYRDALGVREIDTQKRRVDLHFTRSGLERCEGEIPILDGMMSLYWERRQQTIHYRCTVPIGYSLHVSSAEGLTPLQTGH